MRFMLLIYPSERAETGAPPDADLVTERMKYNEELARAGVLVALDALHPSARGARVDFASGRPRVSDGPFSETKDIVGGYWMLQVKSKEEAIEWARRCPPRDARFLELRQVRETSDFPEERRESAENAAIRRAIEPPRS